MYDTESECIKELLDKLNNKIYTEAINLHPDLVKYLKEHLQSCPVIQRFVYRTSQEFSREGRGFDEYLQVINSVVRI